jgi:lysyl-tRNA synthetase class 2
VSEAFLRSAGWNPVKEDDPGRFDTDFVSKVLPGFDPHRPTVLMDYPASQASLARLKPDDKSVAERAEVFIGGLELANAYTELVEAREQKERFLKAIEQIRRERGQHFAMPQTFIAAVACLPECGGVALGIDRLVMLLCDADAIDDVMSFTTDTA